MVWAGLLSGGLGVAQGAIGQHAATKDRRNARSRGVGHVRKLTPRLGELYDQSENELRRSRADIDRGFTDALRETESLGSTGARRILERRKAREAGISQSASSRGLSGTSFAADQQRGLEHDTQRQLSDNDSRFAGIRAQLHQGRGVALSGASRDLAQHYKLRFAAEDRAIYQRYLDLVGGGAGGGNIISQDLSGLGGALLDIGGSIGSLFGGGSSGAAGGGAGLNSAFNAASGG